MGVDSAIAMDAFSRSAEEAAYHAEVVRPPSQEELTALRRDLEFWIPDLPSFFRAKRVLDIGAGSGRHGILLAQSFQPVMVISVDIVLHRLRAGVSASRDLNLFSLVCGDAFLLPFSDASFDCIIANSLLHHLPNLGSALREITRVLRPGGWYVGREPNFDNPAVRVAVFGLTGARSRPSRHTPNEYPLRAKEIRSSFAENGCRCQLHYFWRRFPALKHPTLSAAISVRAQRMLDNTPADFG